MGEMGTFCLVWSPLDLGYFYSLVAVEEIEEKTWPGLLERAAERLTLGCLFTVSSSPHYRTAGVPGSALQSCLDSFCAGVSLPIYQAGLFCLPGALANSVYPTPLFLAPPFQCDCCFYHLGSRCSGGTVYVWRLGVTSQPCAFSQVLDTDPPCPLCLMSHDEG